MLEPEQLLLRSSGAAAKIDKSSKAGAGAALKFIQLQHPDINIITDQWSSG